VPNGGDVTVEEAVVADPELLEAMRELLPQLSSSAPPLTAYTLDDVVESRATVLLVARDGQAKIVGSLALVIFRVPTGVRAWIEDVVVNESARGSGVGSALVNAALARAAEAGARTVDLTSRPGREGANRLYQRLGFETRQTNVYRRTLGPPATGD
jgi:ribosomal protein S18 acetylase RimI-like enzyme